MSLRVGVVGGGGFGQALGAASVRHGHEVVLWSRKKRPVPEGVRSSQQLGDVTACDLIFLAVPARHAPKLADQLGTVVDGRHLIVHVSRGLIGSELQTITSVLRESTAARRFGALAGPLVAKALEEGRPSGAILGTRFPELSEMVREAIGGAELRLYETTDVVGVQLASAMVGFLTVVLAYAQARGVEPGTLAVLATRGMAEMSRVGKTLGADEETFMGLAGLGDLIAAVAGDDRPESRLGRALAQGSEVAEALTEAGAYVEGFEVARHLMEHAERLGMETPIAATFHAVSTGKMNHDDAARVLMERRVGKE